jgi:hypothetical protein
MKRRIILSMIISLIIIGITVAEIDNEQPIAKGSAIPQECFACECNAIILDASGSYDKDGQVVNCEWYYNSNLIAEGQRISLGKEFTKNPKTYRINLVVTDNGGATDDYDLEFIVKGNPTPAIKKLKHTDEDFFVFGDEISVTAILEKKNYGKLNYNWNYDSGVFKKIGDGNKVVFEVISDEAIWKDYKIEVVVSNACGEKDGEDIKIEVRPSKPDSLLKTEIILPLEIEEGKRFRVKSSFVAERGMDVSYLWKMFNGDGVLIKPYSSRENPSFTFSDSGMYTITLEIKDRYQRKGSDTEIFEVKEMINDPPIADASATLKTAVFGKAFLLNANKSRDPDGPPRKAIDRYCWYDKTYGEALGCSRWPVLNITLNRSGPHDIKLTVKDTGENAGRDNEFPKPLYDSDFITINVIKLSDISATTPVPTQPAHYYLPQNQRTPAPETPGMGFWMVIAALIIVVALRRKKIKIS